LNPIDIIPHKKPMVLIDQVVSVEGLQILAVFTITPNSLFQDENGNVPSWIGIEYMAQTIAAFAGFNHKHNNVPIKLGFLLGARTYEAFVDCFLQGKSYLVEATQIYLDSGLGSFECLIKDKLSNIICCSAKVNVYESDDINNLKI